MVKMSPNSFAILLNLFTCSVFSESLAIKKDVANNGNKTKAAVDLQITRRRLYSRMKIYDIKSGPDGTFA